MATSKKLKITTSYEHYEDSRAEHVHILRVELSVVVVFLSELCCPSYLMLFVTVIHFSADQRACNLFLTLMMWNE